MYLAISLTVKIVPSDMWRVTIYLFFMHLEPHTSNECIFNRFDIEIRAHDFYPLKMILYLKNVLCPYHLYCDIMKRKNSYNILVDHTCAFYNLTSFLVKVSLGDDMIWYAIFKFFLAGEVSGMKILPYWLWNIIIVKFCKRKTTKFSNMYSLIWYTWTYC